MKAMLTPILIALCALLLAGCAVFEKIPGVSSLIGPDSVSVGVIASAIEAPRTPDGDLTREGRLMVHATFLLTVAETASQRSMAPGERAVVAAQLRTAGVELLEAANSDGWFIEQDAQEAVNIAVAIVGEAAVSRALRVASGQVSIDGVVEIVETKQTSVNMMAGMRRISVAYQDGELTDEQVIEIIRARFEQALTRLDG